MELNIRKADNEDLPIIYDLAIRLIEGYEDLTIIDYPKVKEWLKKKIASCKYDYFVLYSTSANVGYFHLSAENGMMEIDDLYILEEYQNKGIGTAIIKGIISHYPDVFLYVFKRNIKALALYERLGFEVVRDLGTRYIMEYHQKSNQNQ